MKISSRSIEVSIRQKLSQKLHDLLTFSRTIGPSVAEAANRGMCRGNTCRNHPVRAYSFRKSFHSLTRCTSSIAMQHNFSWNLGALVTSSRNGVSLTTSGEVKTVLYVSSRILISSVQAAKMSKNRRSGWGGEGF